MTDAELDALEAKLRDEAEWYTGWEQRIGTLAQEDKESYELLIQAVDAIRDLRQRVKELEAALEPFGALELGPAGYCSFPLVQIVEDAKNVLVKANEPS